LWEVGKLMKRCSHRCWSWVKAFFFSFLFFVEFLVLIFLLLTLISSPDRNCHHYNFALFDFHHKKMFDQSKRLRSGAIQSAKFVKKGKRKLVNTKHRYVFSKNCFDFKKLKQLHSRQSLWKAIHLKVVFLLNLQLNDIFWNSL